MCHRYGLKTVTKLCHLGVYEAVALAHWLRQLEADAEGDVAASVGAPRDALLLVYVYFP